MLRFLCFATMALTAHVAAQNTECAMATTISSLPATLDGDLTIAPPIIHLRTDSCAIASTGPVPGNWYSFTAESDGCLTATVESTSQPFFDTILTAYIDGCDALSCAAMNDDISIIRVDVSQLNINVEAQTTYHFFVRGLFPEEFGSFTFNITQADGTCERPTGNTWCSACPDGGVADPSAIFDTDEIVRCNDMGEYFELVEGSEFCISHQIVGSVVCGCQPVNEVTCPLCPGGEDVPDPDLPAMTLSGGTTCGDLNVVSGVDSCGAYKSGLANQCQCPGSPEPCIMCPGSTTYNPAVVVLNEDDFLTCGHFALFFEELQVMFPLTVFCEPLLMDYLTGLNVVDFCCNAAELVTAVDTTLPPSPLVLTYAPSARPETGAPTSLSSTTAPATATTPTFTSAPETPTAPGSTPTPTSLTGPPSTTAPDAMTEASTGTPTDVLTMVPAGTPLSIGSSASHVTASSLLFYSVIGLLVKSYLEA